MTDGPSRRALLTGVLVGAVGTLTGCTAAGGSSRASTAGRASSADTAPTASPAAPVTTSRSPALASSATVPPPGPDIVAGPTSTAAVALTFHGAGDPAITQDVLRELASAGAFMTVMAIGTWLVEDPAMAKLVLDGGHELGNHTWSHPTMPRLDAAAAQVEVARGAQELKTLTGSIGRWFRPSGTAASTPVIRQAATDAGYGACLMYDVDPLDYTDPGAAAIERNLLGVVRAGSIVSLHLGHPGTRDALPAILDGLRTRGLSAVTVSRLLGVA